MYMLALSWATLLIIHGPTLYQKEAYLNIHLLLSWSLPVHDIQHCTQIHTQTHTGTHAHPHPHMHAHPYPPTHIPTHPHMMHILPNTVAIAPSLYVQLWPRWACPCWTWARIPAPLSPVSSLAGQLPGSCDSHDSHSLERGRENGNNMVSTQTLKVMEWGLHTFFYSPHAGTYVRTLVTYTLYIPLSDSSSSK